MFNSLLCHYSFFTPKQINAQHIVFVKCMKGQLLLYSGLVRVCRISAGKSTDVTVCFVMSLVQVRDGYERGVCGGRQLCGVPAVLLLRQSGFCLPTSHRVMGNFLQTNSTTGTPGIR